MDFIEYFGKTRRGKIIVFDIFTFNNLFSLLLNEGLSHDDIIRFVISECELNGYVFQECIHNKAFLKLKPKFIPFEEAGRRSLLHQLALSYLSN